MKEKAINQRIGDQVRMLRLSKNLSQEALADELNISISTLSNLERGHTEFTVSRLYEILAFLEINVFEFLKMIHKDGEGIHSTQLMEDPLFYSKFNSKTEKLEEEIRLIKIALEQLQLKNK